MPEWLLRLLAECNVKLSDEDRARMALALGPDASAEEVDRIASELNRLISEAA